MAKFKISKMNQGGYDVAFGDSYYTFPSAPTPVAAAVAGMQAVIAENPSVRPIDLVKSMDDRGLQQGVIKQWTNLVKSGTAGGVPTPQSPRIQAEPAPQQFQGFGNQRPGQVPVAPGQQLRAPDRPSQNLRPDVPLITRRQAMAFLQHRIEELHKAQVEKDSSTLQKTARGYAGVLPQMEGPAAINAMIKNLNTTFIRISMMPAEIAQGAAEAQAMGVYVPTPEEYFQGHQMYPGLARDVKKWIDAGNYVEE